MANVGAHLQLKKCRGMFIACQDKKAAIVTPTSPFLMSVLRDLEAWNQGIPDGKSRIFSIYVKLMLT